MTVRLFGIRRHEYNGKAEWYDTERGWSPGANAVAYNPEVHRS